MTERDLQRWSREVAEDPGAPSFVRLARAYRREGRRTAARDVVLGGLAAHPEHVDAHCLLALIHVEDGDRQQARDEWETVLSLDPGNFDASRGLGFLALERNDLGAARRHLVAAGRARPEDPAVAQALQVLGRRESEARSGTDREPAPAAGTRSARDPLLLFSTLAEEAPFRGALVLDDQGMILAGRLEDDDHPDDLLGALLSVGVAEAQRTVSMLQLGEWEGMLLETESATLHVTALRRGVVLVMVAERDAPSGWVFRTADRARALALPYVEDGR